MISGVGFSLVNETEYSINNSRFRTECAKVKEMKRVNSRFEKERLP